MEKFERKSAYSEKLRDPRWQKMRLEILNRDEWSCQICFDDKTTLNVHHLWYLAGRDPWEYPDDALVTLCERCHELEGPALRESTEYLIHVMKTAGAMSDSFREFAQPFHGPYLRDSTDTWAVIAFGLGEILQAAHRRTDFWHALRERYYTDLRQQDISTASTKDDGP